MSNFVMSDKYPCFVRGIELLGCKVISSEIVSAFPKPEQQHADMQILPINDDIFILNECNLLAEKLVSNKLIFCENEAGHNYPGNVLLNYLYINNSLYGKLSAMDKRLYEYCKVNGIKLVNINQGYARCSTLVVNDRAVITSDLSIKQALQNNGVEVLLISPENIELDGYDYGFIGGASGKIDEKTIVFFGNIELHPDYTHIKNFCNKHDVDVRIICKDMRLTDIGGIVKI